MKQKIKFTIFAVSLVFTQAFYANIFLSNSAFAATCVDNGTKSGVDIVVEGEDDCADKTAFSFGECGNEQVGIECLADEILTFVTVLVGIAVVGGITAGGIMFSVARGNAGETQKAVKIITNSVLGLVLYLLMFAIINFLIPGGVFS